MREGFRLALNILSILTAAAAAYYWLKASSVATPTSFTIHVVKPSQHVLMGPDADYMGVGQSQELTHLARALVTQSRLSAIGARFAGASAILLAITTLV